MRPMRSAPASVRGQRPGQAVITAIQALQKTLTAEQRASSNNLSSRESAIRWSNLPVGVVPRAGLRLGDLDEKQNYAARRVAAAALSACGLKMLDEIRIADHFLKAVDEMQDRLGRRQLLHEPPRHAVRTQAVDAADRRTPHRLQPHVQRQARRRDAAVLRQRAHPLHHGRHRIRAARRAKRGHVEILRTRWRTTARRNSRALSPTS